MSALPRYDFAPWSLSEAVVSDFVRRGAHLFEDAVDPQGCAELLAEVRAARRIDESLFLSEAEYAAAPVAGAAGNLLDRLAGRLGFVERAPQLVEALWSLLGPDYAVLDRRLVCEVPAQALPDWLRRRGHGHPTRGLSSYVRPEHRDMIYLRGTDFHQDLIAAPTRGADFVTLYVYLHPVGEADAPLHLLEGSHRLGASAFPHELRPAGGARWRYRNGAHGEATVTQQPLVGGAGLAALWHPCLLHGTPPDQGERERIALRYRFARGAAASAGIDAVNAALAGPASLAELGAGAASAPCDAPRWHLGVKG